MNTELAEGFLEKQLNKFPKIQVSLKKQDVSNKDKVSDFVLNSFSCKACNDIPYEPVECKACCSIFCKKCSIVAQPTIKSRNDKRSSFLPTLVEMSCKEVQKYNEKWCKHLI